MRDTCFEIGVRDRCEPEGGVKSGQVLLCRDADGLGAPCPGNIAQRFGHQAAAQPAAAVCSIDQHAADRGFGVGDPRRDDPQEGHYAAADLAPTATNARQLGYTLVTDPVLLRRMSEYTLGVFGKLADRLSHPLVRPWLSRLLPDVYRYVPVFRKMRREYAGGNDRILRGATAVLLIHAPKESRFGAEDANLAYQNASLMAEALGVSQIYMGFVLTAVRQDRKKGLCKMLGLGGRRICAVMALGMPQFRYPNYIDRTPSPLERR